MKTRKQALLESIKKWDKICFEGKGEIGSDDCPLCGLFVGKFCKGCPVRAVTDEINCRNTPYAPWDKLFPDDSEDRIAKTNKEMDAAIQEYLFLCMLYHEYYA